MNDVDTPATWASSMRGVTAGRQPQVAGSRHEVSIESTSASRSSRPSAASRSTANAVTTLVTDPDRKIVSGLTGVPSSMDATPQVRVTTGSAPTE